MHELRYFQEIWALSDDIDTLWILKCQFIVDDYFEDPSVLKIFYKGGAEWIFDFLPTKKQASQYVVGELCPPFVLAQLAAKFRVPGAVEALSNRRVDNART